MMPLVYLSLTSLAAGIAVFFVISMLFTRLSAVSVKLKTTGLPAVPHFSMKERIDRTKTILAMDHRSPGARRIRLAISAVCSLISFIAGGNIIFALMAGAGTYAAIGWWYGRKKEKERQIFDDQLIESLGMIATAVRTGQSLMQALETMVKESKPPLSSIFADALAQTRLGLPLPEALTAMAKKAQSDELRIVVTSIVLARETGGNLGEIMQRIAETMRMRKNIKGKIVTLTAQGKASGIIMSLVPAFLLILLTLIEPGLYGLLFSTLAGNIMLCIAALMVACGAFFIKKITSIDF